MIEHLTVRKGKLGVSVERRPARLVLQEKQRVSNALLAARTGGKSFTELPGTAWEVAKIEERFRLGKHSVTIKMGEDASEQGLWELTRSGELSKYKFLHFATHGDINNEVPGRSSLIVSEVNLPDPLEQVRNQRRIFDGRVSVAEVAAEWHLNANLVTVSACNTAMGKRTGGEGFLGFTQALLLSGAESLCLSLWDVDDTATALLMDRFYANLLGQRSDQDRPMSKIRALTEAQAWLRQLSKSEADALIAAMSKGIVRGKGHRTKVVAPVIPTPRSENSPPFEHPYYWAAFTLIGIP